MPGRKEEELGETGRAVTPLGETIRTWRRYRRLTVTALAIRAGFGETGRGYISKIEHGYIKHVTGKRLAAIADALEIAAEDLLAYRLPSDEQPKVPVSAHDDSPGGHTDAGRFLSGMLEARLARAEVQLAAASLDLARADSAVGKSDEARDLKQRATDRRTQREGRKSGVVTASAGNHAQGIALGAASLGMSAVIVMPTGASGEPAVEARRGHALLTGSESTPKHSRNAQAGLLIRQFRLSRKRLGTAGRRDYSSMTKAEFAAEYNRAAAHVTGRTHMVGDSYVSKLESGYLDLTPERLEIVARALNLELWERALLEEAVGFRGLLNYLATALAIQSPNTAALIERVIRGEIALQDLKQLINGWVSAVQHELTEHVRTSQLPTAANSDEDEARSPEDEDLTKLFESIDRFLGLDPLARANTTSSTAPVPSPEQQSPDRQRDLPRVHSRRRGVFGSQISRVETYAGTRCLVLDGISDVFVPREVLASRGQFLIDHGRAAARDIDEILASYAMRQALVHAQLSNQSCNIYELYPRQVVHRLVQQGVLSTEDRFASLGAPPLDIRQRLAILENLVQFLRSYPTYHLGLLDEDRAGLRLSESVQASFWLVKQNRTVLLDTYRPRSQGSGDEVDLELTDPQHVQGFYNHFFQRLWGQLPPENTDREHVVAYLLMQIDELRATVRGDARQDQPVLLAQPANNPTGYQQPPAEMQTVAEGDPGIAIRQEGNLFARELEAILAARGRKLADLRHIGIHWQTVRALTKPGMRAGLNPRDMKLVIEAFALTDEEVHRLDMAISVMANARSQLRGMPQDREPHAAESQLPARIESVNLSQHWSAFWQDYFAARPHGTAELLAHVLHAASGTIAHWRSSNAAISAKQVSALLQWQETPLRLDRAEATKLIQLSLCSAGYSEEAIRAIAVRFTASERS